MGDDSKKAYIEKLEEKLREWTDEFDKLKGKVESSEVKIKEEYHKKMEDLHSRKEDIRERIKNLQEASGEAWEEIKFGTEDAWDEMKIAIDKAVAKFRHKTD